MKLTERSAKWVETVLANVEAKTGRSLSQWATLARKARVSDANGARAWGKAQGLSIVYQTAVADHLFPSEESDGAMVDAQYRGAKAPLRPVYEAIIKAARALGDDVEVMPRKSQVTLSRAKSFAVIRAGANDRVDVALKLHGEKGSSRLVADAQAMKSDPSHLVFVRALKEVDKELIGWLRKAYDRAGSK